MSFFNASDLRKNPTTAEIQLWQHLRAHRLGGFKFRRQHTIGRTIVDFVCLKQKLIVEVDGTIHDTRKEYDMKRDRWLRGEGFRILRFKNEEVEKNPYFVVSKIKAVLNNKTRSG